MTHKIFCFIGRQFGNNDMRVMAVTEDGYVIAQHISSNEGLAKYDIGITSERKHDLYREKFPDGYELEWVADPKHHAGLDAAAELAKIRGE